MSAILWTFDNLEKIDGHAVTTEGAPKLIETPAGKALAFDGANDIVYVANHPLASAETWTIEAVFRPDGGAFEQRWLHLAEADPVNGDAQTPRTLFELRVVEQNWYLDAFTTGPGYNKALIVPENLFPVGKWYTVQQSFDGKIYRAYVDGVLQDEAEITYVPQGAGRTGIGMRINKATPFQGAVHSARFTTRALTPAEFAKLPEGL